MHEKFGVLTNGQTASLYTIQSGAITAVFSDLGATLVKLFVPDRNGNLADVVLGFDDPQAYCESGTFFGAVVGRNANRIAGGAFALNGKKYQLDKNNGNNNLHSGLDFFKNRIWQVLEQEEAVITFGLTSPHGDQGFPGNAEISVRYALEQGNTLRVTYTATSDRDTVFNFTNHSYFNMAGHDKPEKAMDQILTMPARFFTPSDEESIPTGEKRSVEGTAMDFRTPKAIGRDVDLPEEPMIFQKGYDHNFEVFANPCAILSDPESGRTVAVSTDCPGMQLYSGNFLEGEMGKDGVSYCRRGGVCLETQFYPDSLNKPQWPQPVTPAGVKYCSETTFVFTAEQV